jgi:large subunit ribosomal protein L18
MNVTEIKQVRRKRRRLSVRRRLRHGERPLRLSVHRSSKHIYAQVIDDAKGATLCSVGTSAKEVRSELAGKNKTDRAAFIGAEIARIAKEKGVEKVVFDRGFAKYHGRVKALADAARAGGLKF